MGITTYVSGKEKNFGQFKMILDEYTNDLEAMRASLPPDAHISTMTFTSSLDRVHETLGAFLSSLTPEMVRSRGMTSVPRIRQSTFSKAAFDIQLYPDLAPKVKAKVFVTTGSIVITGCESHMYAFLVTDDLQRLFGVPVRYPEPKLINISFSLHVPLDIHHIARAIAPRATFVDLPEQYSNRLIVGTNGGKVQIFGSGSIVIHAKGYLSAIACWKLVKMHV